MSELWAICLDSQICIVYWYSSEFAGLPVSNSVSDEQNFEVKIIADIFAHLSKLPIDWQILRWIEFVITNIIYRIALFINHFEH